MVVIPFQVEEVVVVPCLEVEEVLIPCQEEAEEFQIQEEEGVEVVLPYQGEEEEYPFLEAVGVSPSLVEGVECLILEVGVSLDLEVQGLIRHLEPEEHLLHFGLVGVIDLAFLRFLEH